mgnify:CR=1 FL=1
MTKNRAEICMSVCGLVALVTPLLLWVSWSKEMLKLVLAMGFAAFLLATFFAQYACPEAVEPEENDIPKPEDLPIKVEGQLTVSRQAEKGWRNRS